MKLNSLRIKNFRCFRDFYITFAPGVTVLIGKNGAGKSTLIDAVHKALSFMFISDKSYKGPLLSDGIKSLRPENFSENTDFLLDKETGYSVKEISIEATGEIDHQPLHWGMLASTQTYMLNKSAFSSAAYKFLDIINQRKILPVLAFYSDTYPYRSKKSVAEKITTSPTFGYYSWNSYAGMTGYFVERLAQNLTVINFHRDNIQQIDSCISDAKRIGSDVVAYSGDIYSYPQIAHEREKEKRTLDECLAENEFIEMALRSFLKDDDTLPFKRIRPGRQSGSLFIEDGAGRLWPMEHLPAGYRRLLYMVIDIAYRSFFLNKGKESDGIVIIDEVDLHLHPSLESTIVERLHRTFPRIQFILSTHSALVISNLDTPEKVGSRENVVYKMVQDSEEPTSLPNLKGIDANTMYNDWMETPSRDVVLEKMLTRYVELYSRDRKDEAATLLAKIKSQFGDTDFINKEAASRVEDL